VQLDALKGQQSDISKQLEVLKCEAIPKKEELDQVQTLDSEVAQGEALLSDLNKKSSKLRAKVRFRYPISVHLLDLVDKEQKLRHWGLLPHPILNT
jgi:hypothetical protein